MVAGSQLVDAYSVSQGDIWSGGLSRCLPVGPLQQSTSSMAASELEEYELPSTAVDEVRGVGLTAQRGVREEQRVCRAGVLFFDGPAIVLSFLSMPDNGVHTERVASIPMGKEG